MNLPPPQRDAGKALSIFAGTDSLANIGDPKGAGNRQNVSIEKLWQEQVEANFPATAQEQDEKKAEENATAKMHLFKNDKVDKMRIQKDKELEDYRREIERSKRFEKSKLLQEKAGRKQ